LIYQIIWVNASIVTIAVIEARYDNAYPGTHLKFVNYYSFANKQFNGSSGLCGIHVTFTSSLFGPL